MKKEIKVQNSKLKLVKLDYQLGDDKLSVHKNNLKYQIVFFTSLCPKIESSNLCERVSLCGIGTEETGEFYVQVPSSISNKWQEAWLLEKTATTNPPESLDMDDKKVILSVVTELLGDHLDSAEIMCRSLKDAELMKCFYESYGSMRDLLMLSKQKYDGNGIKDDGNINSTLSYSTKRKYGVYELLHDLVNDKALIYTDSELIGKYVNISRKTKDDSTFVPDKWKNILGLLGNRTRANLSLTYYGVVSVNVPENDLGVTPGPRELKTIKSLCIIKDGTLWTPSFGVKVNSKSLIKKLKAVGVVKSDLVYADELYLDLTKLPIIRKEKMKVMSIDLARAEASIRLAEVADMYLSCKEWMDKKKVTVLPQKLEHTEKDEAEQFLNKLGIYGDKYIPTHVTSSTDSAYEAYEVVSSISGVPKDPYTQVRNYINGSKKCNEIVKCFLDSQVVPGLRSRTYSELRDYWKNEKDKNIAKLRDLKFRLIMNKTLSLYEHKSPKATNYRYYIHIPNAHQKICVKWSVKKSLIRV